MGAGAINWGQEAINAGQGIVSTGLGLILEKHNDKRQLRQQQKLQDMQMKGQMAMTDYNTGKQMEMWKATGPTGQMEQLKEAGLNPGLIYGMGGAGGQSTSIAQGSVSGGNAPQGGGEVQTMALQREMLRAQIENVKADTANKSANTGQTGVNTEISKLKLELDQYALGNYKSMTDMEMSRLRNEVQVLWLQRDILEGTKDPIIDKAKADVTATYAEIALKRASTGKTEEEIKKISSEIGQMAQKLANETQETAIKQQLADFETKWGNDAGSILKQLVGKIIKPR